MGEFVKKKLQAWKLILTMPWFLGASENLRLNDFVSKRHGKKLVLPDFSVPGSPVLISANSLDYLEKGHMKEYEEMYETQAPKNIFSLLKSCSEKKMDISRAQRKESTFSKTVTNIHRTKRNICDDTISPEGIWFYLWLTLVSCCFVYNCWVIPLRSVFPVQNPHNTPIWLVCDYIADIIYLMDIVFVQPRVKYMEDGFWIDDIVLTRSNYFKMLEFKVDVLSLLPTDLIYIKIGFDKTWLRLPRILKVHTLWKLLDSAENEAQSAIAVRTIRALLYILYLIHLNACTYYLFSVWNGQELSIWASSNNTTPYLQCFYFATKTTTAIGRNPKPESVEESVFTCVSWLMGVFVFAILVGQMRENIATATHFKTEYRNLVDGTLEYMRRFNVNNRLQDRVKLWLTFTLEQQQSLDEKTILNVLPPKLKTDIALHVHIQTLKKVHIFQDCDPALLRDLVLKLRPTLFLPGDYICHKGEVGKEMYILKMGEVLVMGGPTGEEVLAVLKEGSVFGEISLLALNTGNRRTADVKSKGFSNLFILSKADFDETIINYPDTEEILKKKAKILMKENAEREQNFKANLARNKIRKRRDWQLPDPVCGLAGTTVKCLVTVHKRMNEQMYSAQQ